MQNERTKDEWPACIRTDTRRLNDNERICVFWDSFSGENELRAKAAQRVGRTLDESKFDLTYVGGRTGLIGALADAALNTGGTVIGGMPLALVGREIHHTGLT